MDTDLTMGMRPGPAEESWSIGENPINPPAPRDGGESGDIIASSGVPLLRSTDVVGRRVAAFLIDVLIVFLMGTVVLAGLRLAGSEPSFAGYLLYAGFLIYKILSEGSPGSTLGKGLLKIEVVRMTGEPPGLAAALLRNLLLLPGALLLYIPSLLMMEFSANRQRLGDIVANTLVVRSLPVNPGAAGHQPTVQPVPQLPPSLTTASSAAGRSMIIPGALASPGRTRDLRRLAIGSMIAGAAFVATYCFMTLQWSTGAPGDEYACYPDEKASIWLHSNSATALAIVLGVASVLVVPAVVGFVSRSFSWILIYPVLVFVLVIPSYAIGVFTTSELFPAYTNDICQESAGYLAIFALFLSPVFAVIPAALGTFAGRAWNGTKDQASAS